MQTKVLLCAKHFKKEERCFLVIHGTIEESQKSSKPHSRLMKGWMFLADVSCDNAGWHGNKEVVRLPSNIPGPSPHPPRFCHRQGPPLRDPTPNLEQDTPDGHPSQRWHPCSYQWGRGLQDPHPPGPELHGRCHRRQPAATAGSGAPQPGLPHPQRPLLLGETPA